MGRRSNPIEDQGPLGKFAQRLRDRRPPGLTYRVMGEKVHFSYSKLADAAAGKVFPTWEATEAYVRACGADDEEIKQWRADWQETRNALVNMHRTLSDLGVVVPPRFTAGSGAGGRLRPVQPENAEGDAWRPDPAAVKTFEDLAFQLQKLKIAAGAPSLRTLSAMMTNPPEDLPRGWMVYGSVSTLSEVFNGTRNPTFEMLRYIVFTLLRQVRRHHTGPWTELSHWLEAWNLAKYNHTRPDITRRRRVGPVVLIRPDQVLKPTVDVVANMDTAVAAATLADLPAEIAGQILSDLPTSKAKEVLTAMHTLTNPTGPYADASMSIGEASNDGHPAEQQAAETSGGGASA